MKPVETDELPAEILKHMSVKGKEALLNLINNIYRSNQIPEGLKILIIVPILRNQLPKSVRNTAQLAS